MICSYALDVIWPEIEPKIESIRQRYIEYCDWKTSDVYQACSEGRAQIFNNEEDDSFAVVFLKTNKFTNETILFIWIAYGNCGKRDINIEILKEIARNTGASRMEFESPRTGFDKMPGWKRGMTTYSMEV